MLDLDSTIHQVIIIGSGPAGHTAAIYAARAQLNPVLFEGFMASGIAAGGQLTTTTEVENFPGFPKGISGPEITKLFREQSIRFGTQILTETISKTNLHSYPFQLWREGGESKAPLQTKSLIIATGATAKKLEFPGSDTYWQKGISACAVCDGALPIFRNQVLAVIGGGDSAVEEATYLTKYASKVYLIHRRNQLRASKIMQRRALENLKIEILWDSEVVEAMGEKHSLRKIKVKDRAQTKELDVRGLFFAIGHTPNTELLGEQIALDKDGYIQVKPGSTSTNIEGVFAAGDVQDKKYRQAITAAGSGCMAALDAENWLHTRS